MSRSVEAVETKALNRALQVLADEANSGLSGPLP